MLGRRPGEATAAVPAGPHDHAEQLLGAVDAVNLRPSTTLLGVADPDGWWFAAVFDRSSGGERDPRSFGLPGA